MRNSGVKEQGRRLSVNPDLLRERFLFFLSLECADFSFYTTVFVETSEKKCPSA